MNPYDCEFPYLFEEIVTQDCYRLKSVSFVPDVIFDIGANVGVFTSCCRFLFPKAKVIAVEPDDRNWELLCKHTEHLQGVVRLKRALGSGIVWTKKVEDVCAPYFNGGAQFVSEGSLGISPESLDGYQVYAIDTVSLHNLICCHAGTEEKILLKVDTEGAEMCIFNNKESMAALRRCDYIAMEIHYSMDSSGPAGMSGATIRESISELSNTHLCVFNKRTNLFRATKKEFLL